MESLFQAQPFDVAIKFLSWYELTGGHMATNNIEMICSKNLPLQQNRLGYEIQLSLWHHLDKIQ